MTHLPFIQQSLGDVLSETAHLSTEEFGAYQLLAFAFWQHGALPDDDLRLGRIARATPERWQAMRPALCELFGIDWTPDRLAERRAEVEATHLKNKANGRKGAQIRWKHNGEANGPANGEAIRVANGEANSNHNHNHKTPAYEEKNVTHAPARARDVPSFTDKYQAGKWLGDQGVFPGIPEFDRLRDRLVSGTASWAEIQAAAA